jgi:hypothetical protein
MRRDGRVGYKYVQLRLVGLSYRGIVKRIYAKRTSVSDRIPDQCQPLNQEMLVMFRLHRPTVVRVRADGGVRSAANDGWGERAALGVRRGGPRPRRKKGSALEWE